MGCTTQNIFVCLFLVILSDLGVGGFWEVGGGPCGVGAGSWGLRAGV